MKKEKKVTSKKEKEHIKIECWYRCFWLFSQLSPFLPIKQTAPFDMFPQSLYSRDPIIAYPISRTISSPQAYSPTLRTQTVCYQEPAYCSSHLHDVIVQNQDQNKKRFPEQSIPKKYIDIALSSQLASYISFINSIKNPIKPQATNVIYIWSTHS